ncbi:MAG TPA: hypothetical protein VEH84_10085 [Alphaproteobacteria bacterium]|nr:hypothetical protein [Alphaproteobacteria bacterium]
MPETPQDSAAPRMAEPGLERRDRLVMLPLALAAALAETLLTRELLYGRIDLLKTGLLHALVVGVVGAGCWLAARGREPTLWTLLLPLAILALGPFGAWGLSVNLAIAGAARRNSVPFEEWYESLFPEREEDDSTLLYERLQEGRTGDGDTTAVASFVDIFGLGTFKQKQAAITAMSRRFQPAFTPALKMALNDENPAIRVQAATAVAKLEHDFLTAAEALHRAADERPEDPAAALALARHYDDYAFTGLLDRDREEDNRQKALLYYMGALALDQTLDLARLAVARIMLRRGRVAPAAQWCEDSRRLGVFPPQMALWYMECLFRLGRYEELRAVAAEHREAVLRAVRWNEAVRATVALWTGVPVEPPEDARQAA